MPITRNGSCPSGAGATDWFTGGRSASPPDHRPDPGRVAAALVIFEPGARTAWHTHALGQTITVTSGLA